MFYVLQVSTGESAIAGSAVYRYNTLDEAVATFHSKMGTAMKSLMYATELLMVVDDNGAVYRTEKFTRPAPEPEVEEEGEGNE